MEDIEDYNYIKHKYSGHNYRKVGESLAILKTKSEIVRKKFDEISMLVGNLKFFHCDPKNDEFDPAILEEQNHMGYENYVLLIIKGKAV